MPKKTAKTKTTTRQRSKGSGTLFKRDGRGPWIAFAAGLVERRCSVEAGRCGRSRSSVRQSFRAVRLT